MTLMNHRHLQSTPLPRPPPHKYLGEEHCQDNLGMNIPPFFVDLFHFNELDYGRKINRI